MEDSEHQYLIFGQAVIDLMKNASDTFPENPDQDDWHMTTNHDLYNFYNGLWHKMGDKS